MLRYRYAAPPAKQSIATTRSHRHTRRGGADSSDFRCSPASARWRSSVFRIIPSRSRRATGGRRGRGAMPPGSVGATREVWPAAEAGAVLPAPSPLGPAISRSPRGAGSRAPGLGTGRTTVSGSGSASSAARKASTLSRLGIARGLSMAGRGAERGGSGCLASAAVTRRSKVCRQPAAAGVLTHKLLDVREVGHREARSGYLTAAAPRRT
jgi:hypothetical protein